MKTMAEESFEKLTMAEQESFKRIVNLLLARSFLLQGNYDFEDHRRRSNPDYVFAERHFELLSEYLSMAGFRLERDTQYGVISLSSEFEYTRVKFDKLTTLAVYVLRLIYEEEREKLSLRTEMFTTTGDLVHKMHALKLVKKKPADEKLRQMLRTLNRFSVIEKAEGAWEAADTRLLIQPVILFIVTNERISNMYQLIDDDGAEDDSYEAVEADAADSLASL